jgi:hypothetical protein
LDRTRPPPGGDRRDRRRGSVWRRQVPFVAGVRILEKGEVARVITPNYVCDNIHVAAYAKFVSDISADKGCDKLNPSGYVKTQGALTERFAATLRLRLNMECKVAWQLKPTIRNR